MYELLALNTNLELKRQGYFLQDIILADNE